MDHRICCHDAHRGEWGIAQYANAAMPVKDKLGHHDFDPRPMEIAVSKGNRLSLLTPPV
ncbi:hypothetical protein [Micromonospora violae]|uniref:hypothetical protein n=1 Tax=Micromonospora violae TaxID=1278207 RepID=UPI0033C5F572